MGKSLRVQVSLELTKTSKEKVLPNKTQAIAYVEKELQRAKSGTCKVWYDDEKNFWNEFAFTSAAEFKRLIAIDTEPELVKEFKA